MLKNENRDLIKKRSFEYDWKFIQVNFIIKFCVWS